MKKLFNSFLILLLTAGSAWAADPAYEIGSGSIMSSPPAIGAVAPNTGKFTTLDATMGFKVVGHSLLDSADFVGDVHTSNTSTATFDGPVIVKGAFNFTGQVQGTADNINIGQVAPGKGKFTTLEATGGITGALTGNASTSTALAGNPTDCSANNFATTIDASGNLTCAQVTALGISGSLTQNTSGNAATATALAANGANCSAGQYPLGIDAYGAVESCTAFGLLAVSANSTTQSTTTSTTWVDAVGVSVNITPATTNSKILVIVTPILNAPPGAANICNYRIDRVDSGVDNYIFSSRVYTSDNSGTYFLAATAISHLDSPASTNNLTYKLQISESAGSAGCSINGGSGYVSTITAMEVK